VLLDARLGLVGQLAAAGIEELDAVVLVRIVRGADDHAEVALETLRQVRDAGGRQRADQHHVHARCDEARFERRFEHVAGEPRVLAHEDRAAFGREHARRGTRQPQRELDGERMLADSTAHPIGTEVFACHD
jgi:hypothetical protein